MSRSYLEVMELSPFVFFVFFTKMVFAKKQILFVVLAYVSKSSIWLMIGYLMERHILPSVTEIFDKYPLTSE